MQIFIYTITLFFFACLFGAGSIEMQLTASLVLQKSPADVTDIGRAEKKGNENRRLLWLLHLF
jgi:hypothetical protein